MTHDFRTSARATVALAALTLAAASAAAAQTSATLDVSSSRLRYSGDTATSGAFTIAPTLRTVLPNASLDATAGLSQFAGGGWTTQGVVAGSAYTPWPWVVGELAGTTGGSLHADGNRTAQSLASARLHLLHAGVGAWVGGSLGQTWDSLGWHGVRGSEGGIWAQRDGLTTTLSFAPTRVADSISFTDVQLSLRALVDRADIVATIGRRGGDAGALGGGTQGWLNASAALWIGSNVAITVSGGRYPSDPLQGYRPATYGEIGLRFGVRDFTGARASTAAPDRAPTVTRTRPISVLDRAEEETSRDVSRFELRTGNGDERTIRVRAPSARRVEINGDFTRWQAVILSPAGSGWWTVTLPIAAGTYEMNIRVDGGAWLVPPGATALADEDGGIVGVLVVPGR
jgi:hypothetical protein